MEYKRLFDPGNVVFSDGINERRWVDNHFKNFVTISLGKHLSGNWGVAGDAYKKRNNDHVKNGGTLVSKYIFHKDMPDQTTIIIFTEADRSKTTIRLLKEC